MRLHGNKINKYLGTYILYKMTTDSSIYSETPFSGIVEVISDNNTYVRISGVWRVAKNVIVLDTYHEPYWVMPYYMGVDLGKEDETKWYVINYHYTSGDKDESNGN